MKQYGTLLLLSVAAVAGAQPKPNVVVFYADDFGWGDLRHHNKNLEHFRYTPNLDRMFSEGIELSNYMTHAVCSPSRAGLLTGKHYANVSAGPLTGGTLPNDIRNIAKDFQSAGYKTGAFGKWHNSLPNFPEDGNGVRADFNNESVWNELHGERTLNLTNNIFENHKGWKWGEGVNAYGFDRWVGFYGGGGDHFDHYIDWHHDADWWHDRKYAASELGYRTDLITRHALDFIENSKSGPFFCYIPHEAVHGPIQLLRADVKEFCDKLDTELGIKGRWEYISNLVSPKSGRRFGDVEQLRCERGEEFGIDAVDSGVDRYAHLIYAAYIYTLDKSMGRVFEKIEQLGKTQETIFFFASDNGATPKGVNLPLRGTKHSLWEGGTHVPAAIWWPGTLDSSTKPYTPASNTYEGLITYYDMYPTIMALSGNPCLADRLDGLNCKTHILERTDCRPDALADAVYWMWHDHGSVRTKKWKLFFSESQGRMDLYDIEKDIEETKNIAASKPEVCKTLVQAYKNWISSNDYTASYVTMDRRNIRNPDPAPEGDVLEVKAVQTQVISNPDRDGVFVRFSDGGGWEEEYDAFIHTGDRVEFDIFVCEDSDIVKGCTYNPGNGWEPFYNAKNGLNQDGVSMVDLELPKGKWVRQVVGIGNTCPQVIPVNFIALQSKVPGTYHYYLDNVVIRKNDGGIRMVIWQSKSDFSPLIYRYKKVNYDKLNDAIQKGEMPFSDIQISIKEGSGK